MSSENAQNIANGVESEEEAQAIVDALDASIYAFLIRANTGRGDRELQFMGISYENSGWYSIQVCADGDIKRINILSVDSSDRVSEEIESESYIHPDLNHLAEIFVKPGTARKICIRCYLENKTMTAHLDLKGSVQVPPNQRIKLQRTYSSMDRTRVS